MSLAVLTAWAGLEAWGRGMGVGVMVLGFALVGTLSLLGLLLAVWLVGHLLLRREVCVSRGRISVNGTTFWQPGAAKALLTSDGPGMNYISISAPGNREKAEVGIGPEVDLGKLREFIQSPERSGGEYPIGVEGVSKPEGNEDLKILFVSSSALLAMVGAWFVSVWLGRKLRPGLDVEGWGFILAAGPVVILSAWATAYGVHLLLAKKKGP
jgi:hypothetical protein